MRTIPAEQRGFEICLQCAERLVLRGQLLVCRCCDWSTVAGKKCPTCGQTKPFENFYRNASKPDGRSVECAECGRLRARKRQQSPRVKAVRDAWRKSESGQAMVRRRVRDPAYKAKKAAHRKVERALISGQLVRPERCEQCPSSEDLHAHHDDYSKPLEVRWLCRDCHKRWHREHDDR